MKSPDDIGGNSKIWVTNKNLKAFIKPMTGSERLHNQRLESKLSHRVFIRYISDILNTDRINYNGRHFQIRAIINIEERNKWLELHCEEGVAQ
jgi:SPP1 family predicted phage head-tail adaptor